MITILLARHGQASFGKKNYDELSELGITQARMLGAHYAHTQRRIDAVFSGHLMRQQDSARHFLASYQETVAEQKQSHSPANVPADLSDDRLIAEFNEFNHQDVLTKSNPAFANQAAIAMEIAKADVPKLRLAELFDQAMQRWHGGEYDDDYIESWTQFNERTQRALAQIRDKANSLNTAAKDNRAAEDTTVLVFTSGGVIAAITAQLLEQDSQTAYQLNKRLINTGVTAITLRGETARLLSLNEYSHLFAEGERFVTWR
ncbi:histidine phosphatase family protein [uncultured Psychrobacter sp.]|uniref:histidine phosphatase family protein n=1 Tax=uncultured Psychrobacter sp. TaxID=259303 RepID=UPI00261E6EB0|nr:histidine phosphatase family protein [uncultured Psychrobacter sp.]